MAEPTRLKFFCAVIYAMGSQHLPLTCLPRRERVPKGGGFAFLLVICLGGIVTKHNCKSPLVFY